VELSGQQTCRYCSCTNSNNSIQTI